MSAVFLKIVNMSIAASWLVLAVLLLRLVLKKAPKWTCVVLWGFVAVRLICPFSIESVVSLIPSAQTIRPEIMLDRTPEIATGIGSLDTVLNPIITESFAPEPLASANPLQIWIPVWGNLWVLGILGMLLYTAISYILLRRKVATAVLLRDNIYRSEFVVSPFVLGVFRPRIYLPFEMDGGVLTHVISHEKAHIQRRDHLWKPFGFLILSLHWFNPLIWLGYILLCRDIELACDEKVIREMDSHSKADYTEALVSCSIHRRSIAACPLAFGEVSVKSRVKSVLHYRKPTLWILLAAILICVAVAVCFLTDPVSPTADPLAQEDIVIINNQNGDVVYGEIDGVKITSAITTGLKPYYELSDGTWMANGNRYLYRLEITGRLHNAAADSTFVYLSNLETISFDRAWKASCLSSNTEDYFKPEEAVLVELDTDNSAYGVISNDRMTLFAVDSIDQAISAAILTENNEDRFPETPTGLIPVEAHSLIGLESKSGTPLAGQQNTMEEITAIVQYVYHRYAYTDGTLEDIAGTGTMAAITFTGNSETGYKLKEFWEPDPGSTYADQIRERFPEDMAQQILDPKHPQWSSEDLEARCLKKAEAYVASLTDNPTSSSAA